MYFNDFIGNERVKQELSSLALSGRLPHAIILEGDEGIGKKTLAKEIALNLMCRSGEEKPCRACPQCKKVLQNIHPDIYEYVVSGVKNSFTVDAVRNIINDAYITPNEAEYKIYILGNCQGMNTSAQNAFLKLLEEPPSYVIFIMTVTNKSAFLDTVLSRSVVFSLEGVDSKASAEYIINRNSDISYEDALKASEIWSGNIGKAIESLTDGKLSEISDNANKICNALVGDNEYDLLIACSVFKDDRQGLINTVTFLKTIFRDALFFGDNCDIMSGQADTVKMLSVKLSKSHLYSLINACENIKSLALKYSNNAILITKICYELRRACNR